MQNPANATNPTDTDTIDPAATDPAATGPAATIPQGDLRLLHTDAARELLASSIPARLAYVAPDGTPRVVPTWFEWNGTEIVMATYVTGPAAGVRHPAARLRALRANPAVALTIDTESFPPRSLTIRGRAEIDEVEGLAPEYRTSARRYLGDEGAAGLLAAMDQPGTVQARIVVRPTWVGLLDFAERLPSPLGGVTAT
ncbi:MAG TPA: pyridoxamine 5'-phosphate oxidase family protein [Acidimicrobiales bacterium]